MNKVVYELGLLVEREEKDERKYRNIKGCCKDQ